MQLQNAVLTFTAFCGRIIVRCSILNEYLVKYKIDGEEREEIVICPDSITARRIIAERYTDKSFVGLGVWKRYWKRLKSSNLKD